MRIGMEETVLEKLVKHQPDRVFRKLSRIETGSAQSGHIRNFYPAYIFFNQDTLAGKLGIYFRDKNIRVVLKIMPEPDPRLPLHA